MGHPVLALFVAPFLALKGSAQGEGVDRCDLVLRAAHQLRLDAGVVPRDETILTPRLNLPSKE